MLPHPLAYMPPSGKPTQLFVVLHDDNAAPEHMHPLVQALVAQFPEAMVVIPYGFDSDAGPDSLSQGTRFVWGDPQGWSEVPNVSQRQGVIPYLVQQLAVWQQFSGLGPESTALVGFAQGAVVALDICRQSPLSAGRVLVFSGNYRELPREVPSSLLIHFFHGQEDTRYPLARLQETLAHLGSLNADATLDIAEGLGHELHPVLIEQALHRLTTYIPMRTWKEALGTLEKTERPEGSTLH